VPAVLARIGSGQLRAIAVGTANQSALLPGVPTIAETVPGHESSAWFGILALAKTPRAVIDRLNAAFNDSLGEVGVRKAFPALGVERIGVSPDAFGGYLKAKVADMHAVAQAANLVRQ